MNHGHRICIPASPLIRTDVDGLPYRFGWISPKYSATIFPGSAGSDLSLLPKKVLFGLAKYMGEFLPHVNEILFKQTLLSHHFPFIFSGDRTE
jgi:hypothetical protein